MGSVVVCSGKAELVQLHILKLGVVRRQGGLVALPLRQLKQQANLQLAPVAFVCSLRSLLQAPQVQETSSTVHVENRAICHGKQLIVRFEGTLIVPQVPRAVRNPVQCRFIHLSRPALEVQHSQGATEVLLRHEVFNGRNLSFSNAPGLSALAPRAARLFPDPASQHGGVAWGNALNGSPPSGLAHLSPAALRCRARRKSEQQSRFDMYCARPVLHAVGECCLSRC